MSDARRNDPWVTTRWTLVQAAGEGGDDAMRELLERYRSPIASGLERRLRRYGLDAGDAGDDFVGWLFARGVLRRADADRGRFRCFMQGVLDNYVRHALAARGRTELPGDPVAPDSTEDASKELEREDELAWARTLVDRALASLREHHPDDADLLRRLYGIETPPTSRVDLAAELGIKPNALDQRHHRAKRRFLEAVGAEVRETVGDPKDHEREMALLEKRIWELLGGLE